GAVWSSGVWPPAVPVAPLFVAVAAAGGCALAFGRFGQVLRRSSQAARLGVLFAGLLLPAIAMYPSLFAFATSAKERLVAETYGPEALSQREDLQRRVQQTIDQIDSLPSLAEFVAPSETTPAPDRAFI